MTLHFRFLDFVLNISRNCDFVINSREHRKKAGQEKEFDIGDFMKVRNFTTLQLLSHWTKKKKEKENISIISFNSCNLVVDYYREIKAAVEPNSSFLKSVTTTSFNFWCLKLT